MCGKFAQSRIKFPEILRQMVPGLAEKVKPTDDQPAVNYNVRPATKAFVVRRSTEGIEPAFLRWGLIPFFVKDLSKFNASTINARSEDVDERASFKGPIKRSRCLVPALGFYEPFKYLTETGKTVKYSQPWYIRLKTAEPFCIAGMWDRAKLDSGEVLESFTILTIAENPLIAAFHNRCPAILDPEYYQAWLDPTIKEVDTLRSMLKPVSPELLTGYPVTKYADRSAADDAKCIEPMPGFAGWLDDGWKPMPDADVERLMAEDKVYKKEVAARNKTAKEAQGSLFAEAGSTDAESPSD